jgi:release factor glutamine methyltransferase
MTMAQALHSAGSHLRAAGIADAEIEAELLLRHAAELTREQLFARLQEPLPRSTQREYESMLLRRLAHEPIAYITGRCEFYELELECTPAALIPRPETELMVELTLEWARGPFDAAQGKQGPRAMRVVDVGTGNGAIAVAIAVSAPLARFVAIDLSREALALARRNAEKHGVADRIDFVRGSLLSILRARVDVIVANLPYVPTRLYRKLPLELLDHEPEAALHAGACGTRVIAALIGQAATLLRPGGLLLAEHQWNQGRRLREAARAAFPRARIATKRDLSGKERVLVLENT